MPRPASLSRLATLWRSYQAINGDGIGDLPGLISRLDYLHDLGVRGLWLMLNRGTNGFRFDAVGNFVEEGPTRWAASASGVAHITLAARQMRVFAVTP